jgi:transcription-repair coupling factor (superfamily II helicase)
LTDRFRAPPPEVIHLLEIVAIKKLCRSAGVARVDAGPKGAVLSFKDETFANPEALIAYMTDPKRGVRLRPDNKLVVMRNWRDAEARLDGVNEVLGDLTRMKIDAAA